MDSRRCCLSCVLLRLQFPTRFIRSLANSPLTVEEIGDVEQNRLVEMNVLLSPAMDMILRAVCRHLVSDHFPAVAPCFHLRYYQEEVVSTGYVHLNERLGGGLHRGGIYVLVEPLRGSGGGVAILWQILRYAQRQIVDQNRVEGIRNAIQPSVFIRTEQGPHRDHEAIDGTLYFFCNRGQAFNSINHDEVARLEDYFREFQRPSTIVVDALRFFENFGQDAVTEPSISQWLAVLGIVFGTLDDIIVVLLLDLSLFGREIPLENRLAIACRDLPATTNLTTIELNNPVADFWRVNRMVAPADEQAPAVEEGVGARNVAVVGEVMQAIEEAAEE